MAALEITYNSMDDVEEPFRALYTEQPDGSVKLTGVNGMKTAQDVANVQEALRKERNDNSTLKRTVAALGDRDVNEVLADLDKLAEYKLAAEGKVDDEKIEQIVNSRIATIKGPLERELNQLKTERDELKTTNETLTVRERTRSIDDAIRSANATSKIGKVTDTAMDDVLIRARMAFDVAEDGAIITKDGVGVTPGIDPAAWLQEMAPKAPHWFPPSQGGGAAGNNRGGVAGNNPWTSENWNMTEQSKYYREHGAEAAEKAAKAAGSAVGSATPPAAK